MQYIDIRAVLSRSNPMIMRQISAPEDLSPDELTDCICLAMGITSSIMPDGEKVTGVFDDAKNELTLKELFAREESRILDLRFNAAGKAKMKLTVYLDKLTLEEEKKGEKKKSDPSDAGSKTGTAVPVVTKAFGCNIPSQVRDIRDINYIHANLVKTESITFNDNVYTVRDLEFSQRKTDNSMRRRFAPETALKEVNSLIKLPLRQLIDSINVTELKEMAESNGVYLYSGMKKAGIVNSFCEHYDRMYISHVFDNIGVGEYLAFKDFVFDESPVRNDPSVAKKLVNFINRGLIAYVKKKGYFVASEVVDYFDDLYDTDKEKSFLKDKYLCAAMTACRNLYGIFDFEMFDAVLDKLNVPDINEDDRQVYYDWVHGGYGGFNIEALDSDMCYDKRKMKKPQAKRMYDTLADDYYLPERDEIYSLEQYDIMIGCKAYDELWDIVSEHSGYYYGYGYDYARIIAANIREIIQILHWGGDKDDVYEVLKSHSYRLRWAEGKAVTDVKSKIEDCIKDEMKRMPLVGLRGYSLSNCPAYMKRAYKNRQKMDKLTAPGKKTTSTQKTVAKKAVTRAVPVRRK